MLIMPKEQMNENIEKQCLFSPPFTTAKMYSVLFYSLTTWLADFAISVLHLV